MPLQFEILLAELLDRLSETKSAVVVEANEISVAGLAADVAEQICVLIGDTWPIAIEDRAGSPTPRGQLQAAFQPFRMVLQKPAVDDGRLRLLTLAGFRQALLRADLPSIVEHARCNRGFETYGFQVGGWGQVARPPVVRDALRSPRDLVKETAQERIAPADIGRWILSSKEVVEGDPLFECWAELATVHIVRSLISEIMPDGRLVLRGIVRLQLGAPDGKTYGEIGPRGFSSLQQAAQWVYGNAREAETRLGLFINEMTRSASNNVSCAEGFQNCADALEGARLAFQLGLEGLSKDTMKALSDLRKSLSDETAKLSDVTRQLALAVAGSIFLGMGVILTKQTSNISHMGVVFFGLVIAIYVCFVGLSGHQYILLQRDLRDEWRKVLYRFISDDEYRRMVANPAKKSEDNFYDACIVGAISLGMLFAAMWFIFS